MGITFKKYVPQGQFRSFEQKRTTIKLDKREVGSITEVRDGSGWKVSIAVKREATKSEPAPFKYITFTRTFANEEEARVFITRDWAKIAERYDVYQFEAE